MSTDEETFSMIEGKRPIDISGNYQPIYLKDTVGAIFLGILSLILLIGWRRSEARYRKWNAQKETNDANRSLDTR